MENKFKERLQELISESGKTQNEISRELGIYKQKLSHWKVGFIEPSISDLMMLAKYFDVKLDYLVGLTGDYE